MIEPAPIHYDRIYRFAEGRVRGELKTKLPTGLYYHRPFHTRDVVRVAERIGEMARKRGALTEREVWLLKLAALYHDVGFTHQVKENEPFGAQCAVGELGQLGLSSEDLELVAAAILDTALVRHPRPDLETYHQAPQTKLGKYLCDADLATLGRKDFFKTNEWYRREHNHPLPTQEHLSEEENLRRVHPFLLGHRWHTREAESLFEETKKQNIRELRRRLGLLV
ncbi:HD domain-containing protein [Candidatus Micrarchaeota archaeon]|nr:HD domain-containing protein [Candidatus Micrarchaeota archaeon]